MSLRSITTIEPLSKQFWIGHVTTAQEEAGRCLGGKANEAVYQERVRTKTISAKYRPIYFNYSYTDRSWNWGWITRNTTIFAPPAAAPAAAPERKKTKEEKEEESARQAQLLGSVAFVGAAGLAACLWKTCFSQQQTANYTNEVQTQAFNALPRIPVKQSILQLLDHQSQIDSLNSSRITNYFYAAIALLIGSGTLAAGGFAAVPMLITAGYVIMVVSAAMAAANLGYHWNDQADLRPHYIAIAGDRDRRVQGLADVILNQLTTCEENMQSIFEQPPASFSPARGYAPLYPDLYNSAWQIPSSAVPSAPPIDQVDE